MKIINNMGSREQTKTMKSLFNHHQSFPHVVFSIFTLVKDLHTSSSTGLPKLNPVFLLWFKCPVWLREDD